MTLTAAVPESRPLNSHSSLSETMCQTTAMAWRAWTKMLRKPEQFVDVIVQPLLFTTMFTYIFGGAVAGDVQSYLPLIITGVLAQTALTACMAAGTQLREDMDKGVFNRFRSLPMARIAPLAGPMTADLLRYAIAATLTIAVGMVMGYRPEGGVLGVAAAWVLVVVAGWSMAWVFAWIGTIVRSARAVQGVGLVIMFPLTFLSDAFVPLKSLPEWLQAFVEVNPVHLVIVAIRDLMNEGQLTISVLWALVGCAVIVAVFVPLTMFSYGRKAK